MRQLTSAQDPFAESSKSALVQALQAAVRDTQKTKRASYHAENKPEWWRPGVTVQFCTGEVATVMPFASHGSQPWKIQEARAALCLYNAWKSGEDIGSMEENDDRGVETDQAAHTPVDSPPHRAPVLRKKENVSHPNKPPVIPHVKPKKSVPARVDAMRATRRQSLRSSLRNAHSEQMDLEAAAETDARDESGSVKSGENSSSSHSEDDSTEEVAPRQAVERTTPKMSDVPVDDDDGDEETSPIVLRRGRRAKAKVLTRVASKPNVSKRTKPSEKSTADDAVLPDAEHETDAATKPVANRRAKKRTVRKVSNTLVDVPEVAEASKPKGVIERMARLKTKKPHARKQPDIIPETPDSRVNEEVTPRRRKRARKVSNALQKQDNTPDEKMMGHTRKVKKSNALIDEEMANSEFKNTPDEGSSPESEAPSKSELKEDEDTSPHRTTRVNTATDSPSVDSADNQSDEEDEDIEVKKSSPRRTRNDARSQKRKYAEDKRIPLREKQALNNDEANAVVKKAKPNTPKIADAVRNRSNGTGTPPSGSENEDPNSAQRDMTTSKREMVNSKRQLLVTDRIAGIRKLLTEQLSELDDECENRIRLIRMQRESAVNNMKFKYRNYITKYSPDVLSMPIAEFAKMYGGNLNSVMMKEIEKGITRTLAEFEHSVDNAEVADEEVRAGELQSPRSMTVHERRQAAQMTARKTLRKLRAEQGVTERRTVRRSTRQASKLSQLRARDMVCKRPTVAQTPSVMRTLDLGYRDDCCTPEMLASVRKICQPTRRQPDPLATIAKLRAALDKCEREYYQNNEG